MLQKSMVMRAATKFVALFALWFGLIAGGIAGDHVPRRKLSFSLIINQVSVSKDGTLKLVADGFGDGNRIALGFTMRPQQKWTYCENCPVGSIRFLHIGQIDRVSPGTEAMENLVRACFRLNHDEPVFDRGFDSASVLAYSDLVHGEGVIYLEDPRVVGSFFFDIRITIDIQKRVMTIQFQEESF